MKRHDLTTVDDFKGTWAEARKERDAFYSGKPYDTKSRKQDLITAIRKLGGDV